MCWRPNLVSLFLFFLLWEGLSLCISSPVLPTPRSAILQLIADLRQGMYLHIGISGYRLLSSLCLGALLGAPIGLWIGSSHFLDYWLSPLLYLFYIIPKIILLPIFVILIGIGDGSKITLIASTIFFQILMIARDTAKTVDPKFIHSVRSLGKSKREIFFHVYFPASLPKIFTALRINLGTALAILFLVENFATQAGLGYYIIDALTKFNYPAVFSGILGIALLGISLFQAIDWIEKKICPWAFTQKEKQYG